MSYVMTTAARNNGSNLLSDGMNNAKLKKTIALNRAHIVTFSLPAAVTCPGADKCLKAGYCCAGNYVFPSVVDKLTRNYNASLSDTFVDKINAELSDKWSFTQYVRIHPTGDFYSIGYFGKWVQIAIDNPDVTFYAYTKSVEIVKEYKDRFGLPSNMFIAFSYGSTRDDMIDPEKDSHAVVIGPDDFIPSGYADGSINDVLMCKGHKKIALRYHHPYIKWEDSGFSEIEKPF